MRRGVVCLLVMLAGAAPAGAVEVEQSTAGPCSPIQSGNNNVVNCNGVPQRAMDRLNELLDRKDLDLKQKTAEANEWARRYFEVNAQLEETKNQITAKGEDATLVQTAQDLLHEGKLEEARKIFDRLLQSDEANVGRAAQDSLAAPASLPCSSAWTRRCRTTPRPISIGRTTSVSPMHMQMRCSSRGTIPRQNRCFRSC